MGKAKMTKAKPKRRGGNPLVRFVPDINSGKAWSEMDIFDLRACSEQGDSVAEAALFLCRSKEETRAKAEELGLQLHWLNAKQKQRSAKGQRVRRGTRRQ
jgi:hypothetical protein